jgi:hypothetical protein
MLDVSGQFEISQAVYLPDEGNGKDKPIYERLEGAGRIYRASGNLLIIKDTYKTQPFQFSNCTRGAINHFSLGAAVRMRRYLRESASDYREMVTLTYPGFFPSNGKQVKEHLRRFLQECKREYIRSIGDDGLYSAFWFLEFQARGAPHFHIFATWSADKDWVARTWYFIVGSDDDRHLRAGTRVEFIRSGRAGTISYATKYAAKQEQKAVPSDYENVGRFWGVYGRRAVVSASTWVDAKDLDGVNHQRPLNNFYKFVNMCLLYARMECFKRENGLVLIRMHNQSDQVRVRVFISQLAASTMRFDSMFQDAELDYGYGKCL